MIYKIDTVTLGTERQELKNNGESVAIQKKVFQLLMFLIENRERALTKDEIQEAVWPGTIVSETAITRAILKARRAINDDAQQQNLIKTIHGTGYRFVGEVTETEDTGPLQTEISHQRDIELRGDLLRVATAYGAIAWLVNQIAAMIWEAFELEKLPLQILLAASLLGLPIALAVTWFFKLTNTGLRYRSELTGVGEITVTNWRKYAAIAVIFGIAAGTTVVWQFRDLPQGIPERHRIAVLPLVNHTGDELQNWTRLGLMSLINQEINQANLSTLPTQTVVHMVGEDISDLDADEMLLDRFERTQGVQTIVRPELLQDESGYTLHVSVISKSGVVDLSERGDVIPTELVMNIAPALISRLTPGGYASRFNQGTSLDPFVNELYARGMYEELSGNLTEAQDLFALAMKQDPGFFLAKYEYAITTRYLGEFEEAEPLLKALMIDAEQRENARHILLLCNALGVLYDLKGQMDDAELMYQKGLQLADTAEETLHPANILVNYAILQRNRGNLKASRELLGRSITAYESEGAPVNGAVYNSLANISVNEGNLTEAGTYYQKSLAAYRDQEQPSGEAIALSNLSWLAQQQKQFEESLVFLSESLRIRRQIDDRVGILKSLVRQGSIQYDMGLFDECKRSAEEVLADEHSATENDLRATALALLGMVNSEQEHFEQAESQMEASIDIRSSRADISGRLRMQNLLASVYIKQNKFTEAKSLLTSIMDEAVEKKLPDPEVVARLHLAELEKKSRGSEQSLNLFESTLDRVRLLANDALEKRVSVAYAETLMDVGQMDAAEGLLGFLSDQTPDRDLELARARFAELQTDYGKAVSAMNSAKRLSHQRWTSEDEARLLKYLALSDAQPI